MKFSYMVATNEITGKQVTGMLGDYALLFEKIKNAGYDGVELIMANPFEVDFDKIIRLARSAELKIPVLCTGEFYGQDKLSFADPDSAIRKEAIRRTIEAMNLASEVGAHVNVGRLRGRYVYGVAKEDTEKYAREGFQICAEAQKDVNLLLEPINRNVSNFLLTTQEGIEFIKSVNKPNVRLMLDYIHMAIENEDMAKSVEDAFTYTDHIHVCDSDRLPLGMGSYDLTEFADAVKRKGYQGFVSIEAFDTCDYDRDLKVSYEALVKYFRNVGNEQ